MKQVEIRDGSIRVLIQKGKCNQVKRPQPTTIQPSSRQDGTCPVKVLNKYLTLRKSLPGNNDDEPLFPKFNRVVSPLGEVSVKISSPVEAIKYDSFYQNLKRVCAASCVKATGVGVHHTTHSFRMGYISTKVNTGVNPVFVQAQARHRQSAHFKS